MRLTRRQLVHVIREQVSDAAVSDFATILADLQLSMTYNKETMPSDKYDEFFSGLMSKYSSSQSSIAGERDIEEIVRGAFPAEHRGTDFEELLVALVLDSYVSMSYDASEKDLEDFSLMMQQVVAETFEIVDRETEFEVEREFINPGDKSPKSSSTEPSSRYPKGDIRGRYVVDAQVLVQDQAGEVSDRSMFSIVDTKSGKKFKILAADIPLKIPGTALEIVDIREKERLSGGIASSSLEGLFDGSVSSAGEFMLAMKD